MIAQAPVPHRLPKQSHNQTLFLTFIISSQNSAQVSEVKAQSQCDHVATYLGNSKSDGKFNGQAH